MSNVRKISIISFLVILSFSFAIPAFSFVVLENGYGDELSWRDYRLPVSYKINFQGTPDTSGEFSAIQHAFQTWEDVLSAKISFKYEGKTTNNNGAANDLINLIVWVESDWEQTTGFGSNVIALATTFYSTATGQIFDSDIQFNGENFTWSDSDESGKMDVQNIATHEIGHFLGLADLYAPSDSEKTMYGYSATGETKKRTLDPDDEDGASYLYPASESGPTHISLTGISDPVTSGTSSDVTVTVLDINDNIVTDYTGTIHFSSSDTTSTVPGDYTFVLEDSGKTARR